jgi:hypothetical protein
MSARSSSGVDGETSFNDYNFLIDLGNRRPAVNSGYSLHQQTVAAGASSNPQGRLAIRLDRSSP